MTTSSIKTAFSGSTLDQIHTFLLAPHNEPTFAFGSLGISRAQLSWPRSIYKDSLTCGELEKIVSDVYDTAMRQLRDELKLMSSGHVAVMQGKKLVQCLKGFRQKALVQAVTHSFLSGIAHQFFSYYDGANSEGSVDLINLEKRIQLDEIAYPKPTVEEEPKRSSQSARKENVRSQAESARSARTFADFLFELFSEHPNQKNTSSGPNIFGTHFRRMPGYGSNRWFNESNTQGTDTFYRFINGQWTEMGGNPHEYTPELSANELSFDPYKFMELSHDASQEQIEKRYRELAKKYHPDRNPNDKKATENFQKLGQAYRYLIKTSEANGHR